MDTATSRGDITKQEGNVYKSVGHGSFTGWNKVTTNLALIVQITNDREDRQSTR